MNDKRDYATELSSLKKKFSLGDLDKYSFINERHAFNKLFFEYSNEIKDSLIGKIEILPNSVIFTFKPLNIELQVDNSARSAPFEILNFGGYEPEDENFIFDLIKNKDIILDLGAHIGWFSLNIAKRFPKSIIHAFEPINSSFQLLNNNIQRNNISNILTYNFGISDKCEEKFLYFSKEISPIASIKNLLNQKKVTKLKCKFKSLDDIVSDLNLQTLKFIKCDVEGSELLVLKGGQNVIKKFKPIIFMELFEGFCQTCGYSSSNIIKILKDEGYEIFQVFDNKLKIVQTNILRDDTRFNYFFFHNQMHAEIISANIS